MEKQRYYTLWLSLICIVIFILQVAISGFTEIFMLSENALAMPWQFMTAIFLHANVAHLLYNLFALVIFGMILENLIGGKKFLTLFLASGLLANIISFPFYPNALGASGAIMAIIGTLAILKPLMSVWAFGMIIPMFIAAILWTAGSVLGIFGFGDQTTGHLAHLSGIFVGILYGLILKIRAKRGRNNTLVFRRRIKIPESTARSWENFYFGK